MSTNEAHGREGHEPAPARGLRGLLSRKSPVRRIVRFMLLSCLLSAGVFFGGFLWFADRVATMRPPSGATADAIIALTGGYQRIGQAVDLLRSGAGARLLISGVNPATTASQIRKMTQGSKDLFSCCVDIGYEALDTIGNAREAARWIDDHGYRSVLVVTNNYHMRRSLHELRKANPETDFIAWPVVNSDLTRKNWFSDPDVVRTMMSEYIKTVAAGIRDVTGLESGSGLRNGGREQQKASITLP